MTRPSSAATSTSPTSTTPKTLAPVPPRPPRPAHEESNDDFGVQVEAVTTAARSTSEVAIENVVLESKLSGYIDAWAHVLRPGEPGHTFDGASNPHVADPGECMRYDRVMVRGARPSAIDMLSTCWEHAPAFRMR